MYETRIPIGLTLSDVCADKCAKYNTEWDGDAKGIPEEIDLWDDPREKFSQR